MLFRHQNHRLVASLCLALGACTSVGPTASTMESTPVAIGKNSPADQTLATKSCPVAARAEAQTTKAMALINAERRARGLAGLRASVTLRHIAQAHACDNAARGVYSHFGSDGSDLGKRLRRGNYWLRLAAENTALGFDTPERLVAFWMQSPLHHANMMNPGVTEMGLGLADGARPNWVLVLAKPR